MNRILNIALILILTFSLTSCKAIIKTFNFIGDIFEFIWDIISLPFRFIKWIINLFDDDDKATLLLDNVNDFFNFFT